MKKRATSTFDRIMKNPKRKKFFDKKYKKFVEKEKKVRTFKGWGIVTKDCGDLIVAYPGSKNDGITQAFNDTWLNTDFKFIDKVFKWQRVTITIKG